LKPLLQLAQRSSILSLVALIAAILTGVGFALYINSSITGILRRITTQLQMGAEKLTVVVAQLSSASKNLSSSSSSQASALQQTAASVQQISAMVRKSADSAETSQAASMLTMKVLDAKSTRAINELRKLCR
jgi:methyl-accepting chemotaxis protein